jgi:uncharacterized protein
MSARTKAIGLGIGVGLSLGWVGVWGAVLREPVPWRVTAARPDAVELAAPAAVRLEGFLGLRVSNNAANRLARVDVEPLLAGFRSRPGVHAWIGEHVGKWLHAATLACSYTGDEELKSKLDYTVRELLKCQEPDGYLGTYEVGKRLGLFRGLDWASGREWDVWVHKYNLIGLLTYYQYTGDPAALEACRRMGDLLVATFGPGKRSILSAGTHVGMAATSVLEPMVGLYRATGEVRYLDFCRYVVSSWDEPGGPAIVTSLRRTGSVQKTANGKAYEMMSNLVGLCELVRATGEEAWLEPVRIAWRDIAERRLYLTGGTSQGEHFREDHHLPNEPGANVSETCATVTWLQLNSQLLRLTGEAVFGDELEKVFVNHLAAAQHPDGTRWCYFTALEGAKPYGPGINCCVSSGPRGMALVPQHAFLVERGRGTRPDAVLINLLEAGRAGLSVAGGDLVVEEVHDPTRVGEMVLALSMPRPLRFAVKVRTPAWARPMQVRAERGTGVGQEREGWTELEAREWRDGDRIVVSYRLGGRLVTGTHGNLGRAAVMFGPAVLAYDEAHNPGWGSFRRVGLAATPDRSLVRWDGERPDGEAVFSVPVRRAGRAGLYDAAFVLYADAGSQGSRFAVWLPAPGAEIPTIGSLFEDGEESRSKPGNVEGSILDGTRESFVVTFDGQPQEEAWFAVRVDEGVTLKRVVFAHGKSFHDGGWFDTSAGKPRVEVQRAEGGVWESVGPLASYPSTSGSDPGGLRGGEEFSFLLEVPARVVGLRVVGKPAGGDNPKQAFASCAGLSGFAE